MPLSYVLAVAAVLLVAIWGGVMVVMMFASQAHRARRANIASHISGMDRSRSVVVRQVLAPRTQAADRARPLREGLHNSARTVLHDRQLN